MKSQEKRWFQDRFPGPRLQVQQLPLLRLENLPELPSFEITGGIGELRIDR